MKHKLSYTLRGLLGACGCLGCLTGILNLMLIGCIVLTVLVGGLVAVRMRIPDAIYALRVAKFAWEMDRLYDRLPDQPMDITDGDMVIDRVYVQWGVVTNSRRLEQVIESVAPYYHREAAINPVRPRMGAFIPFAGSTSFELLGAASCAEDVFILNYQYINPFAHLFRRDDLLAVITHEIGHVQGVCYATGVNPSDVEAATQILTWEILAAMSADGNKYAIKPFVGELRDAALSWVRAVLRQQGHDDWYRWFVLRFIYTTAEEQSRAQRGWRYWDRIGDRLDDIIISYGMRPWYYMHNALGAQDLRTDRSWFKYPNASGTIRLDDLAWVLSHLHKIEQIAEEKSLE